MNYRALSAYYHFHNWEHARARTLTSFWYCPIPFGGHSVVRWGLFGRPSRAKHSLPSEGPNKQKLEPSLHLSSLLINDAPLLTIAPTPYGS